MLSRYTSIAILLLAVVMIMTTLIIGKKPKAVKAADPIKIVVAPRQASAPVSSSNTRLMNNAAVNEKPHKESIFQADADRIKATLFSDKRVADIVSVSCDAQACDLFPVGKEEGVYPRAVAAIIAIDSGLRDKELTQLGFAVANQSMFFAPPHGGRLHVSLIRQ